MIDPIQLLQHVIRPTLKELNLHSDQAERLVLGTACQESECGRWLYQLNNGPARGIYQCELATLKDIFASFLPSRPDLLAILKGWVGDNTYWEQELVWNLRFATAICRLHYLRVKEPIPDNLPGQAQYYKLFYNTPLGKATEEQYIASWRRFIPPRLIST